MIEPSECKYCKSKKIKKHFQQGKYHYTTCKECFRVM